MPTINVPAPMAGSVKELLVTVGDSVSAGDELLIIESMKMEIPLESPVAGRIAEILTAAPEQISEGQVLIRLETA
ncbi:MAG: acetyl-CoA carboxylase biotin carboxyl carrier protein subunit [Tepidiformaceae bacterium]